MRTGWLLGLDKASLRLVIGFITWNCEIRSLTVIGNRSQMDSYRVCCDKEELETVEHLLCKLWLRTLGRGYFGSLNSVSRADFKALQGK